MRKKSNKIILEGLKKGESCNLHAKVYVPKILGSITFSTMVNPIVLLLADAQGHNIIIKNHEFHSLRFKNGVQSFAVEDDPLIMEDFSEEDKLFDRIHEIDQSEYQNNSEPAHVVYYATAVPHVIYDQYLGKDMYSYSYSLNHNKKKHFDATGVSLFYDFSPLTMRITKRTNSVGKLIINISASV